MNQITKDVELERFITKVCQYSDKTNNLSPKGRRTLSTSLRKYLYHEMPKKHGEYNIIIRGIVFHEVIRITDISNFINQDLNISSQEIIKISGSSDRCIFFSSENSEIKVVTIVPNWSTGLSNIFKDDSLYDYISWFFHFSEQYLSRASYIEIMGCLALVYNKPSSFMGGNFRKIHSRPNLYTLSKVLNDLSFSTNIRMNSHRQRLFIELYKRVNGLDPFVHRLLFNYIRALELYHSDFFEETITSLDKSINVVEQYLKIRLNMNEANMREKLCEVLELNEKESSNIKRLYEIRCYFGGHPALSKWWDFGEIYTSEELFEFIEIVKIIIIKFLYLESKERVIEKNPEDWYLWFKNNWSTLWETVWFEGMINNDL